jgi:hypothetical protein
MNYTKPTKKRISNKFVDSFQCSSEENSIDEALKSIDEAVKRFHKRVRKPYNINYAFSLDQLLKATDVVCI